MPARHITTVPNLGAAIVAGRDPNTGDEVWLVDPDAPAEQIVRECGQILGDMNERCGQLRTAGQRRALALLLAAVVGLLLPSPIRALYRAHDWAMVAGEWAAVLVGGTLLALALYEHLVMRRLLKRD